MMLWKKEEIGAQEEKDIILVQRYVIQDGAVISYFNKEGHRTEVPPLPND
jgi:hypothetical protein